jgi:hypothetical protein
VKCPRCPDVELLGPPSGGGPLSSSICVRCGGGFLPEDGMARLLEEMSHTREELRELAGLYAGARLPCPSCRTKMSPLVLRGASVDVCFGCGSLWVDKGELESLSGGRYALPAPTAPRVALATVAPAQSLVRVDERSLPRHIGRAVLAGIGAVGVVWWLAGIVPFASGVAGAAALAAAAGLSRREAFDVLPRARRMVRWRGWLAPDARSAAGEAFSPESCVVVRQQWLAGRRLPMVVIDLVDAEGRDLARLKGPMLVHTAWIDAPRYARALGVSVRFDVDPRADDALDESEGRRDDAPPLVKADLVRIEPEGGGAGKRRRLKIAGSGDVALGAIAAEIAARRLTETLDEVLAEHFAFEDAAGERLVRLFSVELLGGRATIIVDVSGTVLGHVSARRNILGDTFVFKGPQGRRNARVHIGLGERRAQLTDGYGRNVGVLEIGPAPPGEAQPVTLTLSPGRLSGDARWGVLALGLHVALAHAVEKL